MASSFTSWTKIEPLTRDNSMIASLQAAIHDPLWMLARQWQLGEFQGEDAGTPVSVHVSVEGARLSRYYAGIPSPSEPNVSIPYNAMEIPLETMVEREPVRSVDGQVSQLRLAVESGMQFLRLLETIGMDAYVPAYLEQYKLLPLEGTQLDQATIRFLSVLRGRALDGRILYEALRESLRAQPIKLPPKPEIKALHQPKLIQVAKSWLDWYETIYSEPKSNPSWNPERMEYGFAVSTHFVGTEHVMEAKEYQEGHLDWHAFNFRPGVSLGALANDHPIVKVTQTLIPTPVSFRGKPASRWWEMEDARVNFGAINTELTDIAKLIFIDFALSFGDDWFIIPIELETGALYQVKSLVVTDTFGVRTKVQPYHEKDGSTAPWRVFQLDNGGKDATGGRRPGEGLLFLPPVLTGNYLNGSPLEEVLLLRDEMANMAWAVERLVEGPLSQAIDRRELHLERRRRVNEQGQTNSSNDHVGALFYKLLNAVPDYWIPLVPVQEKSKDQQGKQKYTVRLQKGKMLTEESGQIVLPTAQGRFLLGNQKLKLFEEEVPRAGALLTRSFQYTRWIDGSTHLWVGREKKTGKGEGWSGLRFDGIEEK